MDDDLQTIHELLGLSRYSLRLLTRLREAETVPKLFGDWHALLLDTAGPTLVSRINRSIDALVWQRLVYDLSIDATALGTFALDRTFFTWSVTEVGELIRPDSGTSARAMAQLVRSDIGWLGFVTALNLAHRPPRGSYRRERKAQRT
jgi:hypothetical protein